jgi:hypothetical protein
MTQNQRKAIWILVLLALIGSLRLGCKYYLYDSGTVGSVAEVQHIYHRAGASLATVYSDSIVQHFPFKGRINWNLLLFRARSVSLSGMVDTNRLAEFMNNHPAVKFLHIGKSKDGVDFTGSPDGIPAYDSAGRPNTWHKVYFQLERAVGERPVIIIGDVDIDSGVGKLTALESQYLNKQ